MKDVIPGIVEFKVIIDPLPTGDKNVAFHSLFGSVGTLAAYQAHPEHVRVAAYVASVMRNRTGMDYVE